jgi:hypothetical protein
MAREMKKKEMNAQISWAEFDLQLGDDKLEITAFKPKTL